MKKGACNWDDISCALRLESQFLLTFTMGPQRKNNNNNNNEKAAKFAKNVNCRFPQPNILMCKKLEVC